MINQFSSVLNLKSNISNLFMGICLLYISACSLFKEKSFYQADSLLRQNTKRGSKNNSIIHSKAIRMYSSSDSADKQYVAEIYPRGFFNYSHEHGFSGTAERIILKGRVKEVKSVRDSAALSQEINLSSEIKESERGIMKTSSKEKEVKAKSTRLPFLGGFIIVGLVLLFVFRKLLKLNFS
jgi:membrane carboxypeptidase/penicillin-binding protein